MLRIFFVACFAGMAAAVKPTYPGNTATIQSKLNEIIRAGQASPSSDDAGVQAKLVADAKAKLQQEADVESRVESLRKDAFALVHANLLKVIHAGGCTRDYAGCPRGWSESGENCVPSLDYNGSCGATNLAGYSAQQKESFAVSCEASWPCQDSKAANVPEWLRGFESYQG